MKVIGIAGYARCGKDTFVNIAKNILTANGYRPTRFAFADMLKDEVQTMLEAHNFQATVRTEDIQKKTQVRPLLVWWGCQRRYESDGGMYWVNEIDKQLAMKDECEARGGHIGSGVALISDVRFPNEARWVHEKWGGSVIHLRRWKSEWRKGGQDDSDEIFTKVYDDAPNEEEARQDPLVEAMADVKTEWEGKGKPTAAEASLEPALMQVVLDALNSTKIFKHQTTGTLSL